MSKHSVCAEIHAIGKILIEDLEERYTEEEIKEGIALWWEERKYIRELAEKSKNQVS